MSLADRRLCHTLTAERGTDGRFGWQSAGNLKEIKAGYGHTNLIVSAYEDVGTLAQEEGLELFEKRAGETEYKIQGDEMAHRFLRRMTEENIYPLKFEIREPSLQEIFVRKAGESK